MRPTGEAAIDNGDYGGDTVAASEAPARDEEGRERAAAWDSPGWSKANWEDFPECCDWDNPDETVCTGAERRPPLQSPSKL